MVRLSAGTGSTDGCVSFNSVMGASGFVHAINRTAARFSCSLTISRYHNSLELQMRAVS